MEFGDLVPGAYSPPVALLQVAGTPGAVQVVYRHAAFLRVHSRPEHLGRSEEYADFPAFIPAIISLRAFSEVASWMNRTSLWGMP